MTQKFYTVLKTCYKHNKISEEEMKEAKKKWKEHMKKVKEEDKWRKNLWKEQTQDKSITRETGNRRVKEEGSTE